MLCLLENMYFVTKNGRMTKKPFQIGIYVSIKSTIDLYDELKDEGVSYLLTSRLNQDGLGKLLSYILKNFVVDFYSIEILIFYPYMEKLYYKLRI